MLPDEVREAVAGVERSLCANYLPSAPVLAQWQTIRAHLLVREAEVKAWQAAEYELQVRCERAEALLRDIDRNGVLSRRVCEAITAHLSENSRG